MSTTDFDFLIAGAGMAGLSLAYRLPHNARILLIDRAPKTMNDRTWCYWEREDGPFEAAVFRRWQHIWVHGDGLSERLAIAPYRYKMLRGADFYAFNRAWLATRPNISLKYGQLERLESDTRRATAWVDGQVYTASWGFNSAFVPDVPQTGYHHLLQHFKGWVIRSSRPIFDSSAATFMDFRTDQANDTRFVYVLPFDAQTALVEYTVFSAALLTDHEYDAGLNQYLRDHLGLTEFERLETEFGVIPMTDAPFPRLHSPRIMNIGIAGGRAKASTGYTFQRAQRQASAIAAAIERSGSPLERSGGFNRHDWMDSVYLNVLLNGRERGSRFFTQLFRRNSAVQVLKFLDEQTTPFEDIALMSTVNIPAFTRAALAVTQSRLLKTRGSR